MSRSGRAGLHLLGGEAIKLRVGIVGDDNPSLGIEHRQAFNHVVEGGIELLVLRPQPLLLLLQQPVLLGELGAQLLALRDIAWVDTQPPPCAAGR